MSCEGYGLLISRWVDGEAKPEDARRAESHIAACAPCRKLADEFRRNAGLLESALGPEPFGHRVAGNVFGTLARREALWRWGARLGTAAAIILSVLLLRADRNEDQKRFSEQITAALRVVEKLQAALDQERGREPVVVAQREWYPVFVGADGKPVEESPLPPAIVSGEAPGPRPIPPVKRPGTFARDRIDARSDYETGNVALDWNMDKFVYASLARPEAPVTYLVYRREDGKTDWGTPINQGLLLEPKFEDVTARGLTTYEYRFAALAGGQIRVSEDIARLKTPPDLCIAYLGGGKKDDLAAFKFRIHVRVNGKWFEETFLVNPGETIGGPHGGVDFSTGVIFRDSAKLAPPGKQYTWPCATLSTPSGRILLWQGTSALGSREQLEANELPR